MAEPKSFSNAAAFRRWLAKHHASETELTLRLFKLNAAHRGLGYKEALDEALCFGWIDGIRRGLDEDSFLTRFTPRRAKSIWSKINLKRVRELQAEGRLQPPGLAALERRTADRTGVYSFEKRPEELPPEFLKMLRADARAWRYYSDQTAGYRRTTTHWVLTARREETRLSRIETLISCSRRGIVVPPLKWGRPRSAKARETARRASR